MNKQNRNRIIDTDVFMFARWEGGPGDEQKKVKGLRSTNWLLQKCHGDVKYCLENIVAKEHKCMSRGHG